jgi:hypothetical protein
MSAQEKNFVRILILSNMHAFRLRKELGVQELIIFRLFPPTLEAQQIGNKQRFVHLHEMLMFIFVSTLKMRNKWQEDFYSNVPTLRWKTFYRL